MKKFTNTAMRCIKMVALPVAAYLLFMLLSSFIGTGNFGSALSLKTALRSSIFTCLVAWGMSFNLLANRWDYSVGASMVLASIVGPNLAVLLGLNAVWTFIFCAIIGAVFCGLVGLVYIYSRIYSIVISLGFLLILEGLSAVFFGGTGVNMTGSPLMSIARFPKLLIPFAVYFLIAYIVFSKTKIGYDLRSMSYGKNVAFNIGINEKRTILVAYALGGLFIGGAGYFNTAMNGIVWPALNASSVVTAFSCCIPVFIGKFLSRYGDMMVGIASGSIMLGIMNTGLAAIGVSSSVQTAFHGVFLLVFLGITANEERVSKYFEAKKIAADALRERCE